MKRKFYEQLAVKIENKKSSNSFLNKEKYELGIQEISLLKRGDRKKEPKEYQLLKRYDAVQIGNTVKLIYPITEMSSSIKYYVQKEDIFDVIHDAHLAIGRSGGNRMIKEIQTKYKKLQQRASCFTYVFAFLASKTRKIQKRFGDQTNDIQCN